MLIFSLGCRAQIVHVKKNNPTRANSQKYTREKFLCTRENSQKYTREKFLCTREKKSKNPVYALEK